MKAIERNPDIYAGTPVFTGTKIPVRLLFQYIKQNHTLSEFQNDFVAVKRQHIIEVIDNYVAYLYTLPIK